MRSVKTLFPFSVHLVVSLSTLMLGLAQGSLFPYVLSLPIVIFSLLSGIRWPRMQISILTANVLGLLAFGLTFAGLMSGNTETRLFAGAHLLVYLSWIVLLQSKKSAQYWWLLALAVLEIAIGAILTTAGFYGGLLVVFLFLSIWTLSLFSLYQAGQRFLPGRRTLSGSDEDKGTGGEADENTAASPAYHPSSASLLQASSVQGSIHRETSNRWFSVRYVFGILGMTLASLLIATMFFLFIPRHWFGKISWGARSDDRAIQRLSGFSEEVQLGSMQGILQSKERVMQVRLYEGGKQLAVEEYSRRLGFAEPLFRGQSLDLYANGVWKSSQSGVRFWLWNLQPSRSNTIRQVIRLEPIGSPVLFAIRPMPIQRIPAARIVDESKRLLISPRGSVLLRSRQISGRQRLVYEVFTRSKPYGEPKTRSESPVLSEKSRYLAFDEERLAELAAYARRIAGYGDHSSQKLMMNRLLHHLRDSGTFTYSLSVKRTKSNTDPVIEFLQEGRRTGHCEYFASALALMLRAVGIPSRLIKGFKGGEQNQLTGNFEVEQRHAHAWVEAQMNGEWIVLDPTPTDDRNLLLQGMSGFRSWNELVNFVTDLWTNYVVDLKLNVQQKKLYDPARKSATDLWHSVSSRNRGKSSFWQAAFAFLTTPGDWFSWRGAIVAFLLATLIFCANWGRRKFAKAFGDIKRTRRRWKSHEQIQIEFYERFCKICATAGWTRKPSQTQSEFAGEVRANLKQNAHLSDTASLPARLVDAFYGVRFGAIPLTPERSRDINRGLTELEHSIVSTRSHGNAASEEPGRANSTLKRNASS